MGSVQAWALGSLLFLFHVSVGTRIFVGSPPPLPPVRCIPWNPEGDGRGRCNTFPVSSESQGSPHVSKAGGSPDPASWLGVSAPRPSRSPVEGADSCPYPEQGWVAGRALAPSLGPRTCVRLTFGGPPSTPPPAARVSSPLRSHLRRPRTEAC